MSIAGKILVTCLLACLAFGPVFSADNKATKEKQLKAVDQGDLDVDKEKDALPEEDKKKFGDLFGFLGKHLTDVKEVRLSTRLKTSAACLVAGEGEMGANMERLMRKMGRDQELPDTQRILELNPKHETVAKLLELYGKNPENPRIPAYGELLYDQAVIAEGSKIKNPAAFAQRVNDLMLQVTSESAGAEA